MNQVTLISTVFNEAASIKRFCDSILSQTDIPDEIVIVDGGSSDDTVKLIKEAFAALAGQCELNVIVDPQCCKKYSKGPIARGRNVAIRNAKYDRILVTDAGCIVDKDWVKNMKECFDEGADIVSGTYKARVTNKFQLYTADIFCPTLPPDMPAKSFLPSSRSLGFEKKIWERAGGYPEDSYTAEDTVFILRAFEQTERVKIAHNAFVYWDLPVDFNELKSKLINYGIGDGYHRLDKKKYFARMVALILFPITVPVMLLKGKKLIALPMYYYMLNGYVKGLLQNK
ncbi:glycosyltransferase [Enterobacter quasimori]|uniref:glycosyltransferase n=1 Tax=Enterobacter quasimori TaxID=2838947 RepID=UPI001C0DB5C8|nr:glycosyltransferase [Enterobacter quasimori]MBT1728451.1 glycosyltransferase [Enterobacter quasimori]